MTRPDLSGQIICPPSTRAWLSDHRSSCVTSAAGVSVPRRDPKLEPLLLSEDERTVLERWTRRAPLAQALALRARIVPACAGPEVPAIVAVARDLRVTADTVRKWRRRFLAERLNGLADEPRRGRPPTISSDQVEAVVVTTLGQLPKNATHSSRKGLLHDRVTAGVYAARAVGWGHDGLVLDGANRARRLWRRRRW
ncbi:helix-turn-helix domain-containing protein [Streptomyces sp. NPDC006617]|uniref:helix-turn-helix domain-containing protein n=1 Tax=Streptomyces sp. NPDC006617 TaxID=3155354 RepID=UPI0033A8F3EB